jgi:hypothetical protein
MPIRNCAPLGAPIWIDLLTSDLDRAKDEFRYSTALFDGDALLGVMDGTRDLPQGAPSTWSFFLGTEDVDKTVQLVTENGGTVIRDAEDTPYGRLAAVADPTGAGFNLSSLDQ